MFFIFIFIFILNLFYLLLVWLRFLQIIKVFAGRINIVIRLILILVLILINIIEWI